MDKSISRQRRWQIKKALQGKCIICGKPKDPRIKEFRCTEHVLKGRKNYRKRLHVITVYKTDKQIGVGSNKK
mgnify:CR=1 FL=1